MFRPQFPMPPPCPGYVWQPCLYAFDGTNTPGLTNISLGTDQESAHIALELDKDAPFLLLACKVGNIALNFKLWDPFGNQLMEDYEDPSEFGSALPPFTVLEGPGVMCPAGSVLLIRLQGQ